MKCCIQFTLAELVAALGEMTSGINDWPSDSQVSLVIDLGMPGQQTLSANSTKKLALQWEIE